MGMRVIKDRPMAIKVKIEVVWIIITWMMITNKTMREMAKKIK